MKSSRSRSSLTAAGAMCTYCPPSVKTIPRRSQWSRRRCAPASSRAAPGARARGLAGEGGDGVRLVEEAGTRPARRGRPARSSASRRRGAGRPGRSGRPRSVWVRRASAWCFVHAARGVVQRGDGRFADAPRRCLEDVREVVQLLLGQVVGEAVVLLGPQAREAEFGPLEVGAEAFDGDPGRQVDRRVEVFQRRYLGDHRLCSPGPVSPGKPCR